MSPTSSVMTSSVSLLHTVHFSTPNRWHQQPVIEATIKASLDISFDEFTVEVIRATILDAFAQIPAERRSLSQAPEPTAVTNVSSVPVLIGQIALYLQQLGGSDVSFFSSAPNSKDDNPRIAVQYADLALGQQAIQTAIDLYNATLRGISPYPSLAHEFLETATAHYLEEKPPETIDAMCQAALRRGIAVTAPVPGQPSLLEYSNGAYRQRFMALNTSSTPSIAVKLAGNKHVTNQLLRDAGLPAPRGEPVLSLDQALESARRIGYPVTLKPLSGSRSRGVYINLRHDQELSEIWELATKATLSRQMLVESFIQGNRHRLFVVDGRMVAALTASAAAVMGDGNHSIRQLLDIENRKRRDDTERLRPVGEIPVNVSLRDMLSRQHLTLETVLEAGQTVQVQPTGLMGLGGIDEDCTASVHPVNADIAVQAAARIGLDITGIDIVTTDISVPLWKTGGAIVDVNSGSGIQYHQRPEGGDSKDVAADIIHMLFPPDRPTRTPVVAIMKSPDSLNLCRHLDDFLTHQGVVVGLSTSAGVRIDGMDFSTVAAPGSGATDVLLNNARTQIAVIEIDPESIDEHGLGFDYCDIAIIPQLSDLETPLGAPVESVLTTVTANTILFPKALATNHQLSVGPAARIQTYAPKAARGVIEKAILPLIERIPRDPSPTIDSVSVATIPPTRIDVAGSGAVEQIIIRAAEWRKIPVHHSAIDPRLLEFGTGHYRRRVRTLSTSLTSHIGVRLAKGKSMTNQLLARGGLPVPNGIIVQTIENAVAAAAEIGYPVVVKPVAGNQAKGVSVDLHSEDEIRTAFPAAQRHGTSPSVMVEEYVVGYAYRVLVINDRVVAAFKRNQASITGDGRHTVSELVALLNASRSRAPAHVRMPRQIQIDEETQRILGHQGINLDSVPSLGQRVPLKSSVPYVGGTTFNCTKALHADNIKIARMAASTIGLDLAGLDIVSPDLTQSMWTTGGAIIEVNSMPGLDLHFRPYAGPADDIGAPIIDMLFPEGEPVEVPVYCVASSPQSNAIINSIEQHFQHTGSVVGISREETTTVAGTPILPSDQSIQTRLRTLLYHPLTEIAIVELDLADVNSIEMQFCVAPVIRSQSDVENLLTHQPDPNV